MLEKINTKCQMMKVLKMDETSSQQVLVCVFDVEKCIVCFEVSEDGISGHSRLE